MNSKNIILILLLLLGSNLEAQQPDREEVYLHLSGQTLISGESLYYSAYCRSEDSGKESKLSKILYIEIIGSNGPIHQGKIILNNGRGAGEFFISSLIPTGRYQILAYTRWMKNYSSYFQGTIDIINPFEAIDQTEEKESKLEIDLFYGDLIVAAIPNSVGFKINDGTAPTNKYTGKLVNDLGDVVVRFTHDSNGYGYFNFTPEVDQVYNIILEDSTGNIHFFKLPMAVKSGYTLNIFEDSNKLKINIYGNIPNDASIMLRITDRQEIILNQQIKPNTSISIELDGLVGKFLKIDLLDPNSKIITSRNFFMPLKLSTNQLEMQSSYKKREKIEPFLNIAPGTYSVSVRKANDDLVSVQNHTINLDWNNGFETSPTNPAAFLPKSFKESMQGFILGSIIKRQKTNVPIMLLPEVRNGFIDGRLTNTQNQPVSNELVILSIIGKPFQIYSATTDSAGSFSLPYEITINNQPVAYVTPAKLDTSLSITTYSPFLSDYPDFNYTLPPLDSLKVIEILEKSIRVQLHNAYFQTDTSHILPSELMAHIPFNSEYNLDDYTRFSTIKETFLEYILGANVREKRVPIIKPHFSSVPEGIKKPPLILLDGLPVDASKILDFGASNIMSIKILNHRMFIGPLTSDGVVLFETFDGNLGMFETSNYHNEVLLDNLTETEKYSFSDYALAAYRNEPDQRDQLFWDPVLQVSNDSTMSFEFYTSDVTGSFEITIEGYTDYGEPISITNTFLVE